MSGKAGSKTLDKIKQLQKNKESTQGKAGAGEGDAKKSKKNQGAWSDDEDDIKIDIQVSEKKADDSSKPTLTSTGAGWEEKDLGIAETVVQKPTTGSKWGNSIQPAEVKIEKEYFPSIGDTYEEGGKSKEKEPAPKVSGATTENQVISEKKPKANSLFAGMTSGTPAPLPTAVAAPVEETGPIKFKNAKAKGSLLQMIDETKPVEVVAKPVEEDGAAPMKFKGKLKVDYKETSTERKQREAEEEARKQSTGLVFGATPKPAEAKPQLAKPGLTAEVRGLDARGAGFGAAKPEAKPMGRGTLPTKEGKEDDGWNRAQPCFSAMIPKGQ